MLILDHDLQSKMVEAVSVFLDSGDLNRWKTLAATHSAFDPFTAVLDDRVVHRIFKDLPGQSFDGWVLSIDNWRETIEDPRTKLSPASQILYELWDRFARDLSDALRIARTIAEIPKTGGVLAFVGALSKCIVVRYGFYGLLPRLQPVAVIDSPKSVFDVWTAVDHADSRARNVLKSILASGHKLIIHKGVFAHVDRRSEAGVFGPTIDTLLLAELVVSFLNNSRCDLNKTNTALEIGAGSGFLSAVIARYASNLKELSCIDIDFKALSCTEKNLRISLATPGASSKVNVNLLSGAFDASFWDRRFDLVVCNPPYIPLPPNYDFSHERAPDFIRAVADIKLLIAILRDAPRILSQHGKLLLMISSVSRDIALKHIPVNFKVSFPLGDPGLEVLFDVEAVLQRPMWIEFLMANGQLKKRNDAYFHVLHPLWVTQN